MKEDRHPRLRLNNGWGSVPKDGSPTRSPNLPYYLLLSLVSVVNISWTKSVTIVGHEGWRCTWGTSRTSVRLRLSRPDPVRTMGCKNPSRVLYDQVAGVNVLVSRFEKRIQLSKLGVLLDHSIFGISVGVRCLFRPPCSSKVTEQVSASRPSTLSVLTLGPVRPLTSVSTVVMGKGNVSITPIS